MVKGMFSHVAAKLFSIFVSERNLMLVIYVGRGLVRKEVCIFTK